METPNEEQLEDAVTRGAIDRYVLETGATQSDETGQIMWSDDQLARIYAQPSGEHLPTPQALYQRPIPSRLSFRNWPAWQDNQDTAIDTTTPIPNELQFVSGACFKAVTRAANPQLIAHNVVSAWAALRQHGMNNRNADPTGVDDHGQSGVRLVRTSTEQSVVIEDAEYLLDTDSLRQALAADTVQLIPGVGDRLESVYRTFVRGLLDETIDSSAIARQPDVSD